MEITASLVTEPAEPLALKGVAAPPDAAATQQFAALMQAPLVESQAAAAAAAAPSVATAVAPASVPSSFGDRILNGMQNVSSAFRETWMHVSNSLSPGSPELGMQQMLSLQLHMTQASVQIDLLGKVVSRSTQSMDQLVRVQ